MSRAMTHSVDARCMRTHTCACVVGLCCVQWSVNGETWRSKRVAATVGSNRWELWHLKTGGEGRQQHLAPMLEHVSA